MRAILHWRTICAAVRGSREPLFHKFIPGVFVRGSKEPLFHKFARESSFFQIFVEERTFMAAPESVWETALAPEQTNLKTS
jgi:hypothetical protein